MTSLQCLREKVAMYSFHVCWVPGKMHLIADALSRTPFFAPEEHPSLEIDTVISCLSQASHPTIDTIYNSIDDDRHLLDDIKNETFLSTYSQSLKGYLNIFSLSLSLSLSLSPTVWFSWTPKGLFFLYQLSSLYSNFSTQVTPASRRPQISPVASISGPV